MKIIKKKFQNLLTTNSNSTNALINLYNPFKEKVLKLDLNDENEKTFTNQNLNLKTENNSIEDDVIIFYRSLEQLKKSMKNVPNLFDIKKDSSNDENIIYKRLEHMQFENGYKKEIERIKKDIEKIKIDRKRKFDNLKEISDKIDDINFNIQFLKNFERFTNIERENQNILNEIKKNKEKMKIHLKNNENNENNNENEKTKLNLNEIFDKTNIKKLTTKELNFFNTKKAIEREKSKNELKKLLPNLIEEKTKFQNELNNDNLKLKNLNSLKKNKINILYKHYLNLLKEGKDTRTEGLSWIITEIYLLEKNVLLSFLPEFLDETGINYLFNQAKIKIELMKIDEQLKQLKNEMSKKGIKKMVTLKNNENNENKNDFYSVKKETINMNIYEYQQNKKIVNDINNNLSNIENLNQLFFIPPVIKINEMNRILNNSHRHFSNAQNNIIENYLNLLDKKENIKKIVYNMKKTEMNRIFNEYLKNDYFKRFKVEKTVVLSALIGEDNVMPELNKHARKAKKYFDSLKQVGMFKNNKVLPQLQNNILKNMKQN